MSSGNCVRRVALPAHSQLDRGSRAVWRRPDRRPNGHGNRQCRKNSRLQRPLSFHVWRLSVIESEPPHLGQARQAIFAIENVDDVPHGRTPLFGQAIKPSLRFRRSSPDRQNGFVGSFGLFRRSPGTKRLHEIESVWGKWKDCAESQGSSIRSGPEIPRAPIGL